jgi:GxxExxY protein
LTTFVPWALDWEARGDAEFAECPMAENKTLDEITGSIVDTCVKLHTGLGPGLLESIYETVLARDLERRGLRVEKQKQISFEYDGLQFNDALRVDIIVESLVVVEIKSVERLSPVHPKQLLTYLRLLKLPVGLLVNFGAPSMKEGLQRIVNGLAPSASPHLRVNRLPTE